MDETVKYKCPFLGEIVLTKIGEYVSAGVTAVHGVYVDSYGEYYVRTFTTFGGTADMTKTISKKTADIIVAYQNSIND